MEGTKYRTSRQQQHHLLPKQMRRIRNLLILVVVAASFLLPNEYFRYANILLANASLSNGICDLECPTNIGSKCAFGESPNMIIMNSNTTATSSSTTTKSINGMHCICPEFYTGIQCEFSFDSCNDKNQHVCYHGGTCQSGGVDQYGNIQHYCDCSNAKDTVTKSPYVGKYCELATVATCDDPIEPNLFCFNGGICNDKFPDYGKPCLCSGGHTGPRCEYTYGDNVTTVNENGIVVQADSAEQQCTLSCANGGVCVLGKRTASDQADEYLYWVDDVDDSADYDMYCQCTDSWDGPTCTIEKAVCGDQHCFFGGTCQTRSENDENNNPIVTHHCDCTTADNADASYAGRFCQYKATTYCTKNPGLNGELFCVNHGICRTNAYEGCDCPYGYEGFSCEFKTVATNEDNVQVVDESGQITAGRPVLDPAESADCSMECQNGGTCRQGPKVLGGGLDLFAGNTSYMNEEIGTSNDFQHCVCPNNFAGTLCEHPLDSCGEKQHLCVHGGKCVELGSEQLCDCDTAESPLATFFAGSHCEHPVNDICTETSPNSVSPSSFTFSNAIPGSAVAFCVNGGTCKAVVPINEPHPGCHCQEGFLGPHCELRESSEVANIRENDPYANQQVQYHDESSGIGGFTVFVLIFSIISLCVLSSYLLHSHLRRRRRRNAAVTSTLQWSVPNFRDGGSTEINIAPKRGSVQYSDDNNLAPYEDEIDLPPKEYVEPWSSTVALRAATRDLLMSEHIGQNSFSGSMDDNEYDDNESENQTILYSLPQIDIGPPIDEDGHELHNVEIV